jgi:TonB-dependent Receptor Plug Domain.
MATRFSALSVARTALLIAGISASAPGQSERATSTIDRARIDAAGWNRLTELLEGATGWSLSSVDGFTFAASPDRLPAAGISAPGAPEWLVLVDGQPVPTNVLGAHFLELLPISIAQIDSVRVTRGPSIVHGIAAPRGAIEIFSVRSRARFSGAASYQHGNETGDPGPYRYTALSSPNIERLGPFAQAYGAFSTKRVGVDVGAHFTSLNITDTILTNHFLPNGFGALPQQVWAAAATARARLDVLGGRHELLASVGRQSGLLFVPALQQAQSATITVPYVGLAGAAPAVGMWLDYIAAVSSIDVDQLASPLPSTIAHSRQRVEARIGVSDTIAGGRATVRVAGGALDWILTRAGSRTSRTALTGSAAISAGLAPRVSTEAELLLARSSARTVGSARVSVGIALDSATLVELRANVVQPLAELDGTWIDRVLATPAASTLGQAVLSDFEVSGSVRRRLGTATSALFVERITSWPLATRDSITLITPGTSDVHPAVLGGVRLRLVTKPVWRITARVEYAVTQRLSSDSAMRTAIESSLANDLQVALLAAIDPDFRLAAAVGLGDGTNWVALASPGQLPAVTPPLRRMDLSAEKWSWHRRIRLQLVLRNLFNQPERYHPFGAQWNLRAHLAAAVMLP